MTFARGHEAQARKAAKVKRRKMLGTKAAGRSAVSKGPWRSPEHLAKIREQECVVMLTSINKYTFCMGALQAHHCRAIGPRTMGVRASDALCVPLCQRHHDMLHKTGDEAIFWRQVAADPAAWIASFSPEGAAEIARIKERAP